MSRTCNVSKAGRYLRILAGIGLVAFALAAHITAGWRTIFMILGAGSLVTGAVRFCPVNKMLGVDASGQQEHGSSSSVSSSS